MSKLIKSFIYPALQQVSCDLSHATCALMDLNYSPSGAKPRLPWFTAFMSKHRVVTELAKRERGSNRRFGARKYIGSRGLEAVLLPARYVRLASTLAGAKSVAVFRRAFRLLGYRILLMCCLTGCEMLGIIGAHAFFATWGDIEGGFVS
jgi:hypothetical protein